MSDLLQSGITWLADRLGESASQAIVLRRGAVEVNTQGTLSSSLIQLETGGGSILTVESADWAVVATAWATLSPAEPQAGDFIDWVTATETRIYQVFPADGEHCYQDLGGRTVLLSVHTKLVTTS